MITAHQSSIILTSYAPLPWPIGHPLCVCRTCPSRRRLLPRNRYLPTSRSRDGVHIRVLYKATDPGQARIRSD